MNFFTGLETLVHVHYDEQLDNYKIMCLAFGRDKKNVLVLLA